MPSSLSELGSDDVLASESNCAEDLRTLDDIADTEPRCFSSSASYATNGHARPRNNISSLENQNFRRTQECGMEGEADSKNRVVLKTRTYSASAEASRSQENTGYTLQSFNDGIISPSVRALQIIQSRRRASVPEKLLHSPEFLSLPSFIVSRDDCSEDWTSIHSAEEPLFLNSDNKNGEETKLNSNLFSIEEVDKKATYSLQMMQTDTPANTSAPSNIKTSTMDKGSTTIPKGSDSSKKPQSNHLHPEAFSRHLNSQLFGSPGPVVEASSKLRRIENFFLVPSQLEKTILLGYSICIDSLLCNLAVVPLRLIFGIFSFVIYPLTGFNEKFRPSRYNQDFIIFGLILCAMSILVKLDMSIMYHDIREQSMIKLYVFFNLLDIFDRLCSSFGADILDSLFERVTKKSQISSFGVPLMVHFLLGTLYLAIHSGVYHYQSVTLNVTINTSNNALLALLISTQFIEIKSTVFKRFEFESLFQITCADIVERVNLSVYLLLNVLLNFSELLHSENGFQRVLLPIPVFALDYFGVSARVLEFQVPGWIFLLWNVATPALIVCASEFLVDWIKHCFVGKFNKQHPDVYRIYRYTLAQDVVDEGGIPRAARRVGMNSLPLALLFIRVLCEILSLSVPNIKFVQVAIDWVIDNTFENIISLAGKSRVHEAVQISVKLLGVMIFLLTIKLIFGFILSKFCANSVRAGIPATHSSVNLPQKLEAVERYTLVKSRVP